jgi:tellurite resistance protein TerC
MSVPASIWAATIAAILVMLAVDMLAHRRSREATTRWSVLWSVAWVAFGTGFGAVVWAAWGAQRAGEYFGGYLLEKSLSADNLLVFAVIFSGFAVPRALRHRVLFFGVLGALVMRAAFIAAGAALLSRFQWIMYTFGAFLLVTAWRMLRDRSERPGPYGSRLIRRVIPATSGYHGRRFWVRQAGRVTATPLLVVLVLIEVSDLIFAVDSIPAVFSVTSEPYLVFTSNAFAILGLRALYFLLDGLLYRFTYLKPGLAVVLGFVGLKMLLSGFIHIPIVVSLTVIAACLAVAAGASLRRPPRESPGPDDVEGDHLLPARPRAGALTRRAPAWPPGRCRVGLPPTGRQARREGRPVGMGRRTG